MGTRRALTMTVKVLWRWCWLLCRCMVSWGRTGKWAAGSSHLIPPCGWWRRRTKCDVWSVRRWQMGREWRAHWRAGGRRWHCAGSSATVACGRHRSPAACVTVPDLGPVLSHGKYSWLLREEKANWLIYILTFTATQIWLIYNHIVIYVSTYLYIIYDIYDFYIYIIIWQNYVPPGSIFALPLSALLNAPLKEPPILTSPSWRSSNMRCCTGIGCRYTWKQLRSFLVTGRVRINSSVNRNTCSFWQETENQQKIRTTSQLFDMRTTVTVTLCLFCSPCHSCCVVRHDTAGSCTAQCEHLSACHQDTPACQCSTGTQTLPSSCWCQTTHLG